MKKYYDENPALFKERRIYSIQDIKIEAPTDDVERLRARLAGAKTIDEFVEYLRANDLRFSGGQAMHGAEQLPLSLLDSIAKLKDGQSMLVPSATGARVVVRVSSRSEPVDEEHARPAIERFLLNEARRKLVDAEVKAMRTVAKIEYIGRYAPAAASTPVAAADTAAIKR